MRAADFGAHLDQLDNQLLGVLGHDGPVQLQVKLLRGLVQTPAHAARTDAAQGDGVGDAAFELLHSLHVDAQVERLR